MGQMARKWIHPSFARSLFMSSRLADPCSVIEGLLLGDIHPVSVPEVQLQLSLDLGVRGGKLLGMLETRQPVCGLEGAWNLLATLSSDRHEGEARVLSLRSWPGPGSLGHSLGISTAHGKGRQHPEQGASNCGSYLLAGGEISVMTCDPRCFLNRAEWNGVEQDRKYSSTSVFIRAAIVLGSFGFPI